MAIVQPKDNLELGRLYQAVLDAGKRMASAEKAYIDAKDDYRRACKAYDDLQKVLSAEHNKVSK